ncbi:MAG: L,D-transpeptidase family protein, partial [Paracoccus sp. (in: a-proteobacteria)]
MPFSAGRPALSLAVSLVLLLAAVVPHPALAQEDRRFSAAEIEAAEYGGGDLPSGRSPLTAKVQLLLDRSGTSPGVIDGFKGGMSLSAIKAFERRAGLPVDGVMDPHVWNLLQAYSTRPVTQSYTITDADAQGLVASIPTDYAEKALMPAMAYTSVAERLAERFHMDERFIEMLNPGVALVPGATIHVMAPNPRIRGEVTRIIIDKENRRVAAYNARGEMVVDYPATIGSSVTPSPAGVHNVRTVAINPNYTYNPAVNFQQGENDRALVIPPGPNGPVGTVWIGLTKPTYGIHGTPTPSQLFRNQSMGCVRLTNWDAEELAGLVRIGGTSVEFLDSGVSIADVTGRGQP